MKRNIITFVIFFSAFSFAQNEHLCTKTPSPTIDGAWTYSVTQNQSIHLGFFEHLDFETRKKIIDTLMNPNTNDLELITTLNNFSSSRGQLTESMKAQYLWFRDEVTNHKIRTFALESPQNLIQLRIDQSVFVSKKINKLNQNLGTNDLLLTIFGPLVFHYNQSDVQEITLVALEDDRILQKQNLSFTIYGNWSRYLNSENVQTIFKNNTTLRDFMTETNKHLVNLYQGAFNDFDHHLKMAEDFQARLDKSAAFQDHEMAVKEAMLNALSAMMLFVKDRRARDHQFAKVLFSQNEKVISVIGTNHQTGVLYYLDELCHAK